MTAEEIENWFLGIFNGIKKKYRPKASGHTSLSTQGKSNLKKLLKRKFTEEQFVMAIEEMYAGAPDCYAMREGMDVPDHILREASFERYWNKADVKKNEADQLAEERRQLKVLDSGGLNALKHAKEEADAREEAERNFVRFTLEMRELYTKSLAAGRWLGVPAGAARIGKEFSSAIPEAVKTEAWNRIKEGVDLENEIKKRNAFWAFSQEMLTYAVEQKIQEPWKG